MNATKSIEERLSAVEAALESLRPIDLSGDQYADFNVRKSPPNWLKSGGHDYAGSTISQTTPEFCEALASFLDWTAQKDEESSRTYVNAKGQTVSPAKFARKDAARARAWAKKMRETSVAPRSDADEIPF